MPGAAAAAGPYIKLGPPETAGALKKTTSSNLILPPDERYTISTFFNKDVFNQTSENDYLKVVEQLYNIGNISTQLGINVTFTGTNVVNFTPELSTIFSNNTDNIHLDHNKHYF
jgi:hypothetical protein